MLSNFLNQLVGVSTVNIQKNRVFLDGHTYSSDPMEWLCIDNLKTLQKWIPLDFIDFNNFFKNNYNGFKLKIYFDHTNITY